MIRAVENVIMAHSSLLSLTTLLDNVKNMVISDGIQVEVRAADVYMCNVCVQISVIRWLSV